MTQVHDISGWIHTGMVLLSGVSGAEILRAAASRFLAGRLPCTSRSSSSGANGHLHRNARACGPRRRAGHRPPLSEFHRPAVVIHVGEKRRNEPVTVADLDRARPDLRPGDAALFATGWDRFWDAPDYVEGALTSSERQRGG